jgi:hypothetical protein
LYDDNLISLRLAFSESYCPATAATDLAEDPVKEEDKELVEGVGDLNGGNNATDTPVNNSQALRSKKCVDYAKFDISK